ncbi:hypothetical protein Pmani_031638 [Petrolisthes manimaculis]|uniref:C2H2-type domain-containing protein n=1 Tax=Petrolisthes manimaculis TaxID=1843537 RepID=A0AAE1TS69_9EUCA|nr:hypothetical protein Pmani_031638 [Petrolisthes manimaculis]
MESVVENFSVVDSMPIIAEEADDNSTHIITSSSGSLTSTTSRTDISDSVAVVSTITNDEGSNQDTTEILAGVEDKSAAEMVNDGMTQIISTHTPGEMFAHDTGQIITSEHQLMSSEHHIFANAEGEIITDDSSSHIIMNADGTNSILQAGGQIITENIKTHILNTGEVITVDGNLIHDAHNLQEHVTEVTECVSADEEQEYESSLLQGIKTEPGEESETSTIQIRVNASAPRKKEQSQSSSGEADKVMTELISSDRPSKYTRVDRDDPRCRLHFVKYMKRDGKTIKIWECGICGKEFMHQYTLMRHLPTHTDERNFRCSQCGKAFRQMSTLSQHKATHSESRPYVCDICQKTFSRVSTLISHKKTHTEEKQHRCTICGKAFHQKGNLKNHLFTHTNERPYKCDVCGRGFNQSSNLQCHKAKSHADGAVTCQYTGDKYKCNFCDQAFARRAQLRQHEEYKHLLRTTHGSRGSSGSRMVSGGNNNALLRKRKIGNVRIIQLPNGDRTFQEIGSNEVLSRQRRLKPRASWKNGILIEPIDTKAMHRALAAGRTPFALLKPTKGVPVVVKVQFALGSRHMLVPATANELRNAGKFTVSSHQSGTKAVQIKVPVVATVIQRIDGDGQIHMDIEAPADDDEDDTSNGLDIDTTITDSQETEDKAPESPTITTVNDNIPVSQQMVITPMVQPAMNDVVLSKEVEDGEVVGDELGSGMGEGVEESSMIIGTMEAGDEAMEFPIDQSGTTDENGEGINSVDLLATAVNLVSQAHMAKDGMEGLEGIQYLRQVNLGEYEVVTADHAQATHIMNEHGHIQQIKMVDEGSAVSVDQANISALMDALQNAGYHLGTGNQQIIINDDGNAMVVDQQVQMVINGDMEGVLSTDGVVSEPLDPSSVNLVVHEVPEVSL